MRHLKHTLFGIILLSSFGSAFADDYDPRQDVFDQVINTLVPTLIVFLNFKEADEKKLISEDEKIQDVVLQNGTEKRGRETQLESKFNKIKKELPPVKIKRAFDDFLFLLSLFVLPSIVFHKNHERPLWISTFSGVTAGIVFIMIVINYISWHIDNEDLKLYNFLFSPPIIDLCHVFSDICFLFYTRSIPTNNFTDAFICIHAVTGVLGAIFFFTTVIILSLNKCGYNFSRKFRRFIDVIGANFGKFLITITFLWTPIVQMLNMALLSGNDYYWTKLILALNLIYISRVLYYVVEKNFGCSKKYSS
ncbi:hypothetical protein RclHR1_00390005 [Rhizophagus clarus]|uniref:TLC domain-containing protein n=1 Tax=Rhizophagus clarus TaxID=94130 RepID=A0A2Z6RF41_9GLOM|nr:hypothetical protein RclHR1_00390005 [Rhizophagus clarus]